MQKSSSSIRGEETPDRAKPPYFDGKITNFHVSLLNSSFSSTKFFFEIRNFFCFLNIFEIMDCSKIAHPPKDRRKRALHDARNRIKLSFPVPEKNRFVDVSTLFSPFCRY